MPESGSLARDGFYLVLHEPKQLVLHFAVASELYVDERQLS